MRDKPLVLVADDREDIRHALRLLLGARGYEVVSTDRPSGVLTHLRSRSFDALLLDLNYTRDITSGREGLDVLDQVKESMPELPVIVMTAWSSVELAVEAGRRGAGDFIEKPWDNHRLLKVLENQLRLSEALRRSDQLAEENRLLSDREETRLIAESAAMQPVLQLIERIGPVDANVLITGEHGTGKGVVARALHARSTRRHRSLITVNLGALTDSLFESELFGHRKGAFTDARENRRGRFSLADRGTLFLDEIGNLSPSSQAKLLRVIETGEYEPVGSSHTEQADVRVLSATNADLPALVREGGFREDLLFRLNTIEVRLPPLRDRGRDIQALADFFLRRYARRHGRPGIDFAPPARRALQSHAWPGNVRELDHAVQRGVLMSDGFDVTAEGLGLESPISPEGPDLETMPLRAVEEHLIRRALLRTEGNVKEAARQLGIGRSSLYRRIDRYGIRA